MLESESFHGVRVKFQLKEINRDPNWMNLEISWFVDLSILRKLSRNLVEIFLL